MPELSDEVNRADLDILVFNRDCLGTAARST